MGSATAVRPLWSPPRFCSLLHRQHAGGGRGRRLPAGKRGMHPQYSGFTDLANWNNVGIIVLNDAVTGIIPATLAPVGYSTNTGSPPQQDHRRTRRQWHRGARAPDRTTEAAGPASETLMMRRRGARKGKAPAALLRCPGPVIRQAGTGRATASLCLGCCGGVGRSRRS